MQNWRKSAAVVLVLSLAIAGCKRHSSQNAAAGEVKREYDQSSDRTTLSSPEISRRIDDREVRCWAEWTFDGTTPARRATSVNLYINSKPSGRGLVDEPVITVKIDGKNLTAGRWASTDVLHGTRVYLIDLPLSQFDQIVDGALLEIEVNDIKMTIVGSDLALLRKLRNQL